MNAKHKLLLAFACAGAFAMSAAELATSTEVVFFADTIVPHAATNLPVSLPYGAGVTLKATPPGGTAATLVSSAGSAGTYSWSASCGGVWTLQNSAEGTTTFTVRYGFFPGTEGDGTAASPRKIMDAEELRDLAGTGAVGDGTVFTLNGADNLLASLKRPAGFAIIVLDDGSYALTAAADGLLIVGGAAAFVADSRFPGPDRKGFRRGPWPGVAYTGDGWAGSATTSSTLTFTPPCGVATNEAHVGTGTVLFSPDKSGVWTIGLAYGSTSLVGTIVVTEKGFSMSIR